MKKNRMCAGCGIKLQNENILNIGFTPNLDSELCMRCYRLKNYGEYESISSELVEYRSILSSVNRSRDLVLYVVDILNIDEDLLNIRDYVKNDLILVLNKCDLLPESIKDDKILKYIKDMNLNFTDIIMISSDNNYHIAELYNKIMKYKKSNNVYVVGFTNAGKSSLINKMILDYGDINHELTISPLPSTTLNKIIININDKLTLIDTPGVIDITNVINYVDKKMYKKLNPRKELKPKTFQVYKGQSLIIGDILRIDYVDGEKNSFVFYIPNDIKIKKISARHDNLKELSVRSIKTKFNEDVVINGLGFIKIVCNAELMIYVNKDVKVFTRKCLI